MVTTMTNRRYVSVYGLTKTAKIPMRPSCMWNGRPFVDPSKDGRPAKPVAPGDHEVQVVDRDDLWSSPPDGHEKAKRVVHIHVISSQL